MTTIRTHGFDSPAQRREYLLELEDDIAEAQPNSGNPDAYDPAAALREIGWLRKEVADLRDRASAMAASEAKALLARRKARPWVQVAAAVAATFVIRRMVKAHHPHLRAR